MNQRRAIVTAAVLVVLATDGPSTPRALACGWSNPSPIFANVVHPGDLDAYERGNLGVVHPTYARRYLVEAYRRFLGRPGGVTDIGAPVDAFIVTNEGATKWLGAREAVLKAGTARRPYGLPTFRSVKPYQSFTNCTAAGFTAAVDTLRARMQRFGADSPLVKEWISGQDAVFDNCGDRKDVALPAALPAGADPILVADRAYQTAAAYFYATDYERAGTLFRAIDADRTSPWRRYGRYLAARALIRQATVIAEGPERLALLGRADRELQAIVSDRTLADQHDAARSLNGYVAMRLRPFDRLHEISARLTGRAAPAQQDVIDYTFLMDRMVGDTVTYSFGGVADRDAMIRGDELTDWIVALQGGDLDRALEQWKSAGSAAWLLAVLWHIPVEHTDLTSVLKAAEAIPRDSPAFATAAFLRVRVIAARGDRDGARRVLATLPDAPGPGFPVEAVNLIKAERFMLATTLDELLRNAARTPAGAGWSFGFRDDAQTDTKPALDRDAELILGERMPMTRLLDAAKSPLLPASLRLAVANAVLTRAIMLRRDDEGLAAVELWRSLEPKVAARFTAYASTSDPEARHQAGILLILRYPRMQAYATSEGGAGTFTDRTMLHGGVNWWCSAVPNRETGASGMYRDYPVTTLPEATYFKKLPDFPEFLTDDERGAAERELQAIAALGTAPNYLADEAAKWARARPKDLLAAEALALSVEGTRWGCSDKETGSYSRRAFQALHRLFPNSTWAKRTKYWYGQQ